MYLKLVLESKACSPVIQILKKYLIFLLLVIFTYLKSIAETFPFN